MSNTLCFPSTTAFETALTASIIPKGEQSQGIQWLRDEAGLHILPERPLGETVLRDLTALGVTGSDRQPTQHAMCWAQALELAPKTPESHGWFLLRTTARELLIALIQDLVAAGAHNASVHFEAPHQLKVYNPPRYLMQRAHEDDRWRVHEQREDGHWQPWGFSHPCRDIQSADRAECVLSHHHQWHRLPSQHWVDLDTLVSFTFQMPATLAKPSEWTPIEIPLRLMSSRETSTERLWRLDWSDRAPFERWLSQLHAEQVSKIRFALFLKVDEPFLLLWSDEPISPPGDTIGYSFKGGSTAIGCPVGLKLTPPLSEQRLNEVFALSPDEIALVTPRGNTVMVQKIKKSAFNPLSEWVRYVVHEQQETLHAWAGAIGPLLQPTNTSDESKRTSKLSTPSEEHGSQNHSAESAPLEQFDATVDSSDLKEPARAPIRHHEPRASPPLSFKAHEREVEPGFIDAVRRLRADPDDVGSWETLAAFHLEHGKDRLALQALARGWWLVPSEEQRARARRWVAETPHEGSTKVWSQFIAGTASSPSHRDAAAADIRAKWLTTNALIKAGTCDQMDLLRVKEELVERVRGGLDPLYDIPAFLSENEEGTRERLRRVTCLENFSQYLHETPRSTHATEESPLCTHVLTAGLLDVGFVLLGDLDQAKTLEKIYDDKEQKPLIRTLLAEYRREMTRLAQRRLHTESREGIPELAGIDNYLLDMVREESFLLRALENHPALRSWLSRGPEASPAGAPESPIGALAMVAPREGLSRFEQLVSTLDRQSDLNTLLRCYAVALAWQREGHANEIAHKLKSAIESNRPALEYESLASELWTLARFGRANGNVDFLQALRPYANTAEVSLAVEGLLAMHGETNDALQLVDQSVKRLDEDIPIRDRIELIRGSALALRCSPIDEALPLLGRLSSQWPNMFDNRITNRHFSLSAIQFVEAMTLAYVGLSYPHDPQMLNREEALFRTRLEADTRREI